MFSDGIVESDAFLDMPLTAQALYFHLGMNADAEGFVNPKRIMRMIGAGQDDLMILISKRFILAFDSGVVVIKHWWINNLKRMDRLSPTNYQHELSQLQLKENRAYTDDLQEIDENETELPEVGNQAATSGLQVVASKQSKVKQSKVTQSKVKQSSSKQFKPNQAGQPAEFNKLNKKTYAQAVRADEGLADKENLARGRPKGSGIETARAVAERLKNRKGAR